MSDGTPPAEGLGAIDLEHAFRRPFVAGAGDIDELGHVNNTVYLRWVQDVAVAHWSTVAPPLLKTRVFFVVLRHEIDYRDPVLAGETVIASTWLGAARGPRFDRHVEIRKQGAAKFSARALTTWCMVNKATGRPERVGADVFAAFGLDPSVLRS